MTGSGKRTHQRQLAKRARTRQQTRAVEQRRRRMKVGIVATSAVLMVLLVGAVLLFKPTPKVDAKPSNTPTPASSPSGKPGKKTGTVSFQGQPPAKVACGAAVPAALNKPKPQFGSPPPQTIDPAKTYTATFDTSCGNFSVQLDPAGTPLAVNNFVFLADQGFYDGTYFPRIVAGFVVQGGDPQGTGGGGPGYTFTTETNPTLKFGSKAGVLAYARGAALNTNGSQFFVTVAPQSFLDTNGPYTAFGTVTQGLSVVTKISALPAQTDAGCASATEQCRTLQAVYLNSVKISVSNPKPTPTASPSK